MGQKYSVEKQYYIFLDLLRIKHIRYETRELEISLGDFFTEVSNIFGYVDMHDMDFDDSLILLESKKLIEYEKKGVTFGKVILKDLFFEEVKKMDAKYLPKRKNIITSTMKTGDTYNISNSKIKKSRLGSEQANINKATKSWQDNIGLYLILIVISGVIAGLIVKFWSQIIDFIK
ncbi:hypothetical protein ACFLS4_03070 [Bacteroidota bacterium]